MTAPTVTRARVRAAVPASAPGRPGREPAAAPPLRVVERDQLSPRARQRRARRVAGALAVVVVLTVFGVAASHVVLAQGQFRLERLERQAAEEQGRYERLRERVAALESPGRIVAAAQERLGMVPPAGVTYLSPSAARVRDAAAPAPTEGAPASSWSTVKQHLGPES